MTEEEIFLAVLDLPETADRTAYLKEACGANTNLRRQVEALLASHFRSGEFLDVPAAEQIKATSNMDVTVTIGGDAMSAEKKSDEESDDLHFLTPATRPDSLGRIGHYEVLQVLGKGGFGIVFRAFDEVLHRVVAVKVLAPQMAATSPARKRFIREARSSAQVRHENVVQVYEVGETPLPYIAMEFIPGETLQQRLNRVGPVEPAEVVRIGRQIAEGLAAAHATDLIHRDIKPGNILLESGAGRVKITDFGLARAADDASISQSGLIAGTPMYMAPEQALGAKLDQRADLFSLGSVLYQMACGRPPFRANSTVAVLKRVAEDTPREIREIVPEVPQWLCDIITKLHAKDPDDRYQSAREVADVLADCEAQLKEHSKLKDFSRIPSRRRNATRLISWRAAISLGLPAAIFLSVTYAVYNGTLEKPNEQKHSAGQTNPQKIGEPPPPAVAPFDAAQAKAHQEAWAKHIGVPVEYTNSIGMKFRLIPPGEFLMGSTPEEIAAALKETGDEKYWQECVKSEAPQHTVILTQPIYLGVHEVTQAEYEKVMGVNPSYFGPMGMGKEAVAGLETAKHPVEMVSWNDAAEFCAKLSRQEKHKPFDFREGEKITPLDGTGYRLPSEAEWEFACRAGTATKHWIGDNDENLIKAGWFIGNSGGRTHAAGELKANPFGLYDIHGNVWERVQDGWIATWYGQFSQKPAVNPHSPIPADSLRMFRGGSFQDLASNCRSSNRQPNRPTDRYPNIGFRVSLHVDAVKAAMREATSSTSKLDPLPPTCKNTLGMEFAIVPKGKSWLGGGRDKLGDKEVEIPADFYLGKYEVTQEEWEKVMGESPSHFSRTGNGKDAVKDISDADLKRYPVDNVSWDQCQVFIAKLNQQEKEKGWVYRLPTEVEWEYAYRGGPMGDKLESAFDFYFAKPTNSLLPEQANFAGDKGLNRPCKVGSYEANKLGLFDMSGNVSEWCDDIIKAGDEPSKRLVRGIGWNVGADYYLHVPRGVSAASFRHFAHGLRLARVPAGAPSPEAKTPPAIAPFTDADVQRIAALPAEQQVEQVRKELMRRNPGFDGKVEPTIENDVVVGLRFHTDEVDNIEPMRALKGLKSLDCPGTDLSIGKLADLSPLKGMPLTSLKIGNSQVRDLEPLKGMPLTTLWMSRSQVRDLAPLKGMKLENLEAEVIPASDVTPIQGMPLKSLVLYGSTSITNLQPIQDMPLLYLNVSELDVSDFSVLKGLKSLE